MTHDFGQTLRPHDQVLFTPAQMWKIEWIFFYSRTSVCMDGGVGSLAGPLSTCWLDCCWACSSSEPSLGLRLGDGPARQHKRCFNMKIMLPMSTHKITRCNNWDCPNIKHNRKWNEVRHYWTAMPEQTCHCRGGKSMLHYCALWGIAIHRSMGGWSLSQHAIL